tara:strand:- start:223 stop:348 length:126 start_codon:yes stop_codon:yes gene_type:complete
MPKDQFVKLKEKSFAWAKANIHWESHIDEMIRCMDAVMSKK